ncbi:MAG: hypothetical protein J4F41_06550 [Alphaproteobacteria bacterium]|nr:hypothetical protein [Alphaproteobacteria bacterium]
MTLVMGKAFVMTVFSHHSQALGQAPPPNATVSIVIEQSRAPVMIYRRALTQYLPFWIIIAVFHQMGR